MDKFIDALALPDLQHANPLLVLAVIVAVGSTFGAIARLIRLPSVTGQILAGLLIGKSGLSLFADDAISGLEPLTHFALGLIAVTVGAHLNYRRLRNAGRRLVLLLIGESIITPLIVFGVIIAIGRGPRESLLYATIAIATAPATIVAIVKESRSKGVFVKTLVAAVALNNMSCITLFEVARAFAATPEGDVWSVDLANPGIQLIVAMTIGSLLGLLSVMFDRFVSRRQLRATAAIIAILIATGATSFLGVSPLLACLFLGMVQTNMTPSKEKLIDVVFEDFEPAILAVFFTMAGMHLSFGHGHAQLSTVGLLSFAFFLSRAAGKLVASDLAMRLAGATERVRRNLGIALIPQAGVAVGLIILIQEDPDFAHIVDLFSAVVLTTVTLDEIAGPILTRLALTRSGEVNMDRSRLLDFIHEENIVVNLKTPTKELAIEKLVDLLISSHHLDDVDRNMLLKTVLDRENEISTCIGGGLAIPHGKLEGNRGIMGVMALNSEGLPFPTFDGRSVHCMVLLVTPPDQQERHLEVLATLARHIGSDPDFQSRLFKANSAAHAYEILHGEETVDFNYFLEE